MHDSMEDHFLTGCILFIVYSRSRPVRALPLYQKYRVDNFNGYVKTEEYWS